ncbi:MAG: hypothetical protein ACTSQK_09375, partial [Candidatus Heimdallarchaeota archaeon]
CNGTLYCLEETFVYQDETFYYLTIWKVNPFIEKSNLWALGFLALIPLPFLIVFIIIKYRKR